MNQADWNTQWKRLSALYPRDFVADDVEMMGVWGTFFKHHDAGAVSGAVNGWTSGHRRAPAIADVMELVKAEKRRNEAFTAPKETTCGHCDHGWEWLGSGDVVRCRHGCLPPLPDTTFRTVEGERSVTAERILALRDTLGQLNPGWRPTYSRTSKRRVL